MKQEWPPARPAGAWGHSGEENNESKGPTQSPTHPPASLPVPPLSLPHRPLHHRHSAHLSGARVTAQLAFLLLLPSRLFSRASTERLDYNHHHLLAFRTHSNYRVLHSPQSMPPAHFPISAASFLPTTLAFSVSPTTLGAFALAAPVPKMLSPSSGHG